MDPIEEFTKIYNSLTSIEERLLSNQQKTNTPVNQSILDLKTTVVQRRDNVSLLDSILNSLILIGIERVIIETQIDYFRPLIISIDHLISENGLLLIEETIGQIGRGKDEEGEKEGEGTVEILKNNFKELIKILKIWDQQEPSLVLKNEDESSSNSPQNLQKYHRIFSLLNTHIFKNNDQNLKSTFPSISDEFDSNISPETPTDNYSVNRWKNLFKILKNQPKFLKGFFAYSKDFLEYNKEMIEYNHDFYSIEHISKVSKIFKPPPIIPPFHQKNKTLILKSGQ